MAHIVAGKLRKPTFIKDGCGPDGMSKMYGIELAEVIKDYKTGEKSYTNYKALFFAKTDAAKSYYDQALAEGSYVVVACEKVKVEEQSGQDGRAYIRLFMENPRLEGANYPETAQSGGWGQPQQAMPQSQPQRQVPQQQQQQRQQAPQRNMQQQNPQQWNEMDDEIPF